MRHLKVVGTVAVAIFALAGASAASATRLCATNTTPCGSIYASDSTFSLHLTAGVAAQLTTFGSPVGTNPTLTCSTSTVGLTNSNQGGAVNTPVAVRLAALTFTGCTSVNPPGCSSSGTVGSLTSATGQIVSGPASLMNGSLTLTPPLVSFTCTIVGAPTTCTFGGSGTVVGTITGGNPATIDFANQNVPATGGFGCPTAATWHAQYRTTVPLYISTS